MQNYRVLVSYRGKHRRGTVLPAWWIGRATPKAELADAIAAEVSRGIIEATHDPVLPETLETLTVPEPKAETDLRQPVLDELAESKKETARLLGENKGLSDQAKSLRAQLDARDKALGQQTAEIERLKKVILEKEELIDQAQEQVEKLTADLEQLTAPV